VISVCTTGMMLGGRNRLIYMMLSLGSEDE
jgi:hypothetical protein